MKEIIVWPPIGLAISWVKTRPVQIASTTLESREASQGKYDVPKKGVPKKVSGLFI